MRAAFYEKDITPPVGCFLTGYFINHVAEDVLDTLHARSVVIESEGNTAAIIEIDSCEFPDDLHDAVTSRVFEYTGIEPSNVLVAVNHTHKGIPITDNPQINAYADKPFKDMVYRLIAVLRIKDDEIDKAADIQTALNTYVEESRIKFVTGEESLDKFDAYVEQLNNLGLTELLDMEKSTYDRFINR